jgi:hypothetical protein
VAGGQLGARLLQLQKNSFPVRTLTSMAKADTEGKPVIAALKRCATQTNCNSGF